MKQILSYPSWIFIFCCIALTAPGNPLFVTFDLRTLTSGANEDQTIVDTQTGLSMRLQSTDYWVTAVEGTGVYRDPNDPSLGMRVVNDYPGNPKIQLTFNRPVRLTSATVSSKLPLSDYADSALTFTQDTWQYRIQDDNFFSDGEHAFPQSISDRTFSANTSFSFANTYRASFNGVY
ncbi:MAG: hypothetical protein ACPF9Q_05460, partial [Opitutales bacterium]